MKMLQSSKYFMISAGISGGTFTGGPSKGIKYIGSISCGYPINGQLKSMNYISPSNEFFQSPSGFFNLNNLVHTKLDGCIMACGSSTITSVYPIPSVFGELYTTTVGNRQWMYNVIVAPGQDYSMRVTLEGNYNNNASGRWSFALGLMWLSATTWVTVTGLPDLIGVPRYRGNYMFQAYSLEIENNLNRIKSFTYQSPLHTSDVSPEQAFALVRETLLNGLSGQTMSPWYPFSANQCITGKEGDISLPSRFGEFDIYALLPETKKVNWSELARQAYNTVPFYNGNGIALAGDILAMKSSVASTTRLIKSLINSNATSRVIANIFLAFYYGWRLLVMDVGELSSAFGKASKLAFGQKCSSHLTNVSKGVSYTYYFHCYYNRYGAQRSGIDMLVSMFDAKLTLSNIWDLIPLSFVVDWFVSVGDILESIDSYGSLVQDHKIICTGRSSKCSTSRSAYASGLNGWMGTLTYSQYIREYTPQVLFPSLILGDINNPLQHVIEGGALIVSKR